MEYTNPLPDFPPSILSCISSEGGTFSEQLKLDLGFEPDCLTLEECKEDNWLCSLFLRTVK